MPRVSDAEKQKSHNRIIDAAARLFRRDGISGTSVADVMHAAGLTQGGFYRHFSSKEDLAAAAFERSADVLIDKTQGATHGQRRTNFITTYLSHAHAVNAEQGCPFAANGSEVVRLGSSVRSEAADAIDQLSTMLNSSDDKTSDDGVAILALLMGTVTLARLAQTDADATRIIEAGKVAAERLTDESR